MRPVSNAYREAIQLHRTQGFRNAMHAEISFGVFADGAKEDSTYTISAGVAFSDADNMYRENQSVATSYALWEKDFFRLDGAQTFLPQNGFLSQGYVSAALADADGLFDSAPAITITFGQHYNVVGLSLLFDAVGQQAAQEVTVKTYDGATLLETEVATNGTGTADFKPELTLDGFDRMEVAFTKTKPYQRVRLNKLLFGIGYIFGNDDIVSLKHKRAAHPLTLSLPQNKLEFTLYNMNNQYDIDAPHSVVRFFEEEQEVTLKYGYDLDGSGNIEWFTGGTFYLYSWDTSGYQATFVAEDIFHKLSQTTYKKGVFDAQYHTITELAADVFEDVGITDFIVSHRFAQTQLPLPYSSHAECLQLLANVAASTLDQDVNGTINIRNRSITDKTEWTLNIAPTSETLPQLPYSDLPGVIESSSVVYATWEQDVFTIDGKMEFAPDSSPYHNNGLALNLFPDDVNLYRPPGLNYAVGLWLDMIRPLTFGSIRLKFPASNRYGIIGIHGWRYDTTLGWVSVYPLKWHQVYGTEVAISDYFNNVQRLYVYVNSNTKYQRLKILSVDINLQVGTEITQDDVIGNVKKELAPPTSDVIVQHLGVWYYAAPYTEELMRTNVIPGQLTEIKHSDAYYRVNATSNVPGVVFDVQEHYAYTSFVKISGVTGETEIILSGASYAKLAERYETRHLLDNGQTAEITNPISKTETDAAVVADLAANYYKNRNQYEMDVLGYPEVDAGDYIIYNGKEVVVLENSITVDGGALRGKMKLRGAGNAVDDT